MTPLTQQEQELLQKKYDTLVEACRRMRAYQIEYFKYRSTGDLERARQWERKVDEMIKSEVKEKQSKQQNLF